MTDPTNHPQGAEEILKKSYITQFTKHHEYNYLYKSTLSAMHTHTEDWLKYFAGEMKGAFIGGAAYLYEAKIDSLLSEVTQKMKEGKP